MNWTKLLTGATLVHEKRSRNRYPPEVVDMLVEKFNFHPFMLGADLGAGAGRLSALFLNYGYDIVAVEADAEKRRECERLRDRWPYFRVVGGEADATGLGDGSVDFVTAPRALYGPDRENVRREIHRILKPHGVAMLITDNRVYDGALQSEAYEDLLRSYCVGFREKTLPNETAADVANFFAPWGAYEDAFTGQQVLTLEALINQTRALTICPPADDPQYAPMMRALRMYFDKWAVDGALVVPTICRVAVGYMG